MSIKVKIISMLMVILLAVSLAGALVLFVISDAKKDADIINILGRQRMLSQAMGKSVLGYAMGKHVLGDIKNNVIQFDKYVAIARKVYTSNIVDTAKRLGVDLSMTPKGETHPSIPFPATFTRMINDEFSAVSKINISIIAEDPINPKQGFDSPSDFEAKKFLASNPGGIFFTDQEKDGALMLRYYTADIASVEACASCHTMLEQRHRHVGDLLGLRRYEVLFSNNANAAYLALHPSLEEYQKAEEVFTITLHAVKNGGKYPVDLETTGYGDVPAIEPPQMRETIANIEMSLDEFKHSIEVITLGDLATADRYEAIESVLTNSNRLRELSDQLVVQYTSTAIKKQRSIRLSVIATTIFVFLVVSGIYLYFVVGIIRPLRRMTGFMTSLAEGDTQSDVPLREMTDEIGNMAKAVEVFRLNAIERGKAEAELVVAKNTAEQANRAKSEFLASMSHELRTPLNAVLGFAQMLQFDPKTPLTSVQTGHVESILSGGNHLLELVNEVLDLARIEANQLDLSIEEVSANDVVEECVALTIPLGGLRDITIIDQFSSKPSVPLRTDRLRFKQSLLNLLSNAVKYNKDGGTVTVDGQQTDDGFLHISVSDTGVGIPVEHQPNVFHMFNRLGVDPLIAQEGTGIGLTVTKLLVERMAGQIGLESVEQVGSTFWIKLPLASNENVLIWTDTMRVGIDAIDKDHQVIISLLNQFAHGPIDDAGVDRAIKELIDYTHYHFRREEAIMEACGDPNLKNHRDLHQSMAMQLNELATNWHKDHDPDFFHQFCAFLRDWFYNHIINTDCGLSLYVGEKDKEIRKALDSLK